MEVVYIKFVRCEFGGGWDYSESDAKTFYEAKNEPAILDIWMTAGKKESYKFKKGAMIRVTTNTVRFNKKDIK